MPARTSHHQSPEAIDCLIPGTERKRNIEIKEQKSRGWWSDVDDNVGNSLSLYTVVSD